MRRIICVWCYTTYVLKRPMTCAFPRTARTRVGRGGWPTMGVQAVLGAIVCVLVGVTLGTVGLIARAVFTCRLKHRYAGSRIGMH